nr:hypothetical protein [Tanacetum cinerariifolium]
MTTLAKFTIIADADNRTPMLKKSMYVSWKSRMKLYIENRDNGRMILNSVLNDPLVWPTVAQEDGTTRIKKYEELSFFEKLQADCDLKATNIFLQGLPPDVYAIINQHKVAKDIWDIVKLLMQGTKLSLQEKECKFLLQEWSKFMTGVKLARDLHTTNYDKLYPYLEQHEAHENETRLMRERYQDPLEFIANFNQPPSHITSYHSPYNATQFSQQIKTMISQVHSPQSYLPMNVAPHLLQPQIIHSSVPPSQQYQSHMDHQTLSVPEIAYHSPQVSNQPISGFPQLDSGLVVHATIQDGRVTMQQVQRRQGQSCIGTGYKGNATSFVGNNKGGQTRVVKCYNCQDEGHMARQCTQPKRPRNAAWFKDKVMLAEAQESGQILNKDQLAFLSNSGILDGQAAQITVPNNAAFQTEDLDAYDSDCDDISTAQAVLMANLSNYGSYVISEVLHSEPYHHDMDNQNVHGI